MKRRDLTELHYITHVRNVPSIMERGIVSHRRAASVTHRSVADPEIQNRRGKVSVPQGNKLHDYVNLYVCARNPMLYKLMNQHSVLCVLRVSTDVLDISGVVVTDGNASSNWVRFAEAPKGLEIVDQELTFADFWSDNDLIEYYKKKRAKCAEVLIPDRVGVEYTMGAYVSRNETKEKLDLLVPNICVTVNSHLFFK